MNTFFAGHGQEGMRLYDNLVASVFLVQEKLILMLEQTTDRNPCPNCLPVALSGRPKKSKLWAILRKLAVRALPPTTLVAVEDSVTTPALMLNPYAAACWFPRMGRDPVALRQLDKHASSTYCLDGQGEDRSYAVLDGCG